MPYKDPEQQRQAVQRHYYANKADWRERARRRRAQRREWFATVVMAGRSCARCDEDDAACLDFHHTNPARKDADVSQLVNGFRSEKRILAEIARCILLCANCHRKLHRDVRLVYAGKLKGR